MEDGTGFKAREVFNNIRVDAPFIARLDGWAFHTFTRDMKYEKPFDERLMFRFVRAARAFFEAFSPSLAYQFSDEISFVFFEPTIFDRIEKLDSLMPSYFSSAFSEPGSPASFDCRIVPVGGEEDVADYLRWRQAECKRNFLNGWGVRMVADADKLSPARAAKSLKGLGGREITEACKERGFDTRYAPLWQQDGVVIHMAHYVKEGFNPITKESVLADRRYAWANFNVPSFFSEEGGRYLASLFSKVKQVRVKGSKPQYL